jgi:ubiquinol-cytochrome c reductase cytochrome c1 subunit
MKKLLVVMLFMALSPVGAFAQEGAKLDAVNVDLGDQASLQRGARIFVNYCLSCHSASYMRYNRVGHDLGISDELVKENLLFASDKIGDLMKAAMRPADAKQWFGTVPPDLTLVARSRGPEWIYTYLRSFYRDPTRPSGWNNVVFPNVAMPHVLYEWQGQQQAVYKTEKVKEGDRVIDEKVFDHFDIAKPGTMTPAEYNAAVRDLTNFLVYLGEPAQLERYRVGLYVIAFLIVFAIVAYLLKREYWKDVH